MSDTVDSKDIEIKQTKKDEARDLRIRKLRRTNEEVFRKKLQEEAKLKCIDYYHAVGKCAKEAGFSSIYACTDKTKECKLNYWMYFSF